MTTQQELEARYGETARASRTRWLAGLLVLGYVALITWAAIGLAGTEVEGNLVGWRAEEREVAVDLEVRGNTPAGAVCAIKATDSYAVDVGYREVRISDLPTTTTVTIPTVIRAGSVTVLGCAAGDEELRVPPPDFPPGVAIP